jgi:hypothetical protein
MSSTAALVTSLMVEGVLGLTARDRFQSLKQYDTTSVFAARWFTITMVVILSVSIITLVVVSLYQHSREMKTWWRNRPQKAEEKRRHKAEDRRQKIEEKRQVIESDKPANVSAGSYESDLKELGKFADTKVVNIARQISSLIESAGLNDEEAANLADYIVSRYAPLEARNGVTK